MERVPYSKLKVEHGGPNQIGHGAVVLGQGASLVRDVAEAPNVFEPGFTGVVDSASVHSNLT